jgi:phosphoribosylanthranilate isomerase
LKFGLTLSGVDEQTRTEDMVLLAREGVEIGVLYTFDPEGRHRYPRLEWIADTALALRGSMSLHVCGKRARAQLFRGQLDGIISLVGRVQVNGIMEETEVITLSQSYPNRAFITQHCPGNMALAGLETPNPNHSLLVDSSGGRGLQTRYWRRPQTSKHVGFAGGLTPWILEEEIPRIAQVARVPWWIDMETGLRGGEGLFSMGRAKQAVEIWKSFQGEEG